jgi:excinuclease ABC subunit C
LYLDKKSESLKLIQQIRDEAHRFGITFHRQKRSSNFLETELDQISGIGKETIRKLLTKFKSVPHIMNLTPEELQQEIGRSKAKIIAEYFAESKLKESK